MIVVVFIFILFLYFYFFILFIFIVLVVGQKRQEKKWRMGKDRIEEVDEYKYLGVWINRQATAHNHV